MKGYELLFTPASRLFSSFFCVFFPLSLLLNTLFFNEDFGFFRAVLGLQQNGEDETEIFYRPSASTHAQPPPVSTSPTRVEHLLQLIPTMTQHNHPKSKVYLRVHSWCCPFYGFMQMYNDVLSILCLFLWLGNSYLSQFNNISLPDTGSFIHSHTEGHLVASKLWK